MLINYVQKPHAYYIYIVRDASLSEILRSRTKSSFQKMDVDFGLGPYLTFFSHLQVDLKKIDWCYPNITTNIYIYIVIKIIIH